MNPSELYDSDFHQWAFDQAQRLRAGQPVDAAHIAEELESLGMNEEQQLENRLIVLLTHMLKCEFQPTKHTRSWDLSIKEQRIRVLGLLEKMPSLRPKLDDAILAAYEIAVIRASDETGIPEENFPAGCQYAAGEILCEGKKGK